ncbi:hypothetical protein IWZ03DRAFT_366910 [Phyllosticta citriasiana]|uniref:Secreted protein n=1 Tax=Phyllosticta citriasiana TaxID=595635 RepID=A0ABR1L258_9PEZI
MAAKGFIVAATGGTLGGLMRRSSEVANKVGRCSATYSIESYWPPQRCSLFVAVEAEATVPCPITSTNSPQSTLLRTPAHLFFPSLCRCATDKLTDRRRYLSDPTKMASDEKHDKLPWPLVRPARVRKCRRSRGDNAQTVGQRWTKSVNCCDPGENLRGLFGGIPLHLDSGRQFLSEPKISLVQRERLGIQERTYTHVVVGVSPTRKARASRSARRVFACSAWLDGGCCCWCCCWCWCCCFSCWLLVSSV